MHSIGRADTWLGPCRRCGGSPVGWHVSHHLRGVMQRYDPSNAPDPVQWMELDEQLRAMLVEEHHRTAGIDLPNVTLHATLHVIVENQLAANDGPVVRAMVRLMGEGLSRHDALHAVASVLAIHMHRLLVAKDESDTPRSEYYAAVDNLTAKKWRKNS